ncbi:hypothetical protein [Streptomyces cucumeris]|uniref:hypothetical protein n=1 Tax=Streptomyces cucumeris TaxID=2962890 RepID=UPI0020C8BEF9|nr:hypothetical protein [Streptomyces sp. NEAU-Y11]MCP9209520.1 hypothetical protein [Streptomyces sp. NEAU-Y11]
MSEVHLACLTAEHAAIVVKEATRPGDDVHTVRRDGNQVVIGYFDKRWPLDIAEWASENCHASDSAAARTIAQL